jgi:hypothetical protein
LQHDVALLSEDFGDLDLTDEIAVEVVDGLGWDAVLLEGVGQFAQDAGDLGGRRRLEGIVAGGDRNLDVFDIVNGLLLSRSRSRRWIE